MKMRRISIDSIPGFRLGNAQDKNAATGCTVIICEEGAVAGVDVRGGGPATRETDLLRSENTVDAINAVVLSGGSAFGLEASSGVMKFLSKKNIGFDAGGIFVPIVCGASLFDLNVGRSDVFPDVKMGIEACNNAYNNDFETGNIGAGCGATCGKLLGKERSMKTGLGSYACGDDFIKVGAISVVNACGDIYNGAGNIIAGLRTSEGDSILGSIKALKGIVHEHSSDATEIQESISDIIRNAYEGRARENTTISCLITNAKLTKSQSNKLASILHDAYARAIKPVHSTLDGDTIFVMSTGEIEVNFDAFAALATDVMQYAIIDAALSCEEAYELPAACDILAKGN